MGEENLRRLEPGRLVADQVYEVLHTAIINGDYAPGTRLLMREVSEALGTSMMPVREAFRRLEQAGCLEKTPYRGSVVRLPTAEELAEIYEVRLLLEPEAARRGAQGAGPETVTAMRSAYAAMAEALTARETVAFMEYEEALIDALYAPGGNDTLAGTVRDLWLRCRFYKLIGIEHVLATLDEEELLRFERSMIAAAEAGDGEAAADLTAESIRLAAARIRERIT